MERDAALELQRAALTIRTAIGIAIHVMGEMGREGGVGMGGMGAGLWTVWDVLHTVIHRKSY